MKVNLTLLKEKKEKIIKKREYYLIDARDVCFIDKDDMCVCLDDYFEKYNVNKEYRKAIFQIIPLSQRVTEFITGINFNTACLISLPNRNIYVEGNSNLIKTINEDKYGYQKYEGIMFKSNIGIKNKYKDMIEFLKYIKNNNELSKYIKSVSRFMSDGLICTRERKITNYLNNLNNNSKYFNEIEVETENYKKLTFY